MTMVAPLCTVRIEVVWHPNRETPRLRNLLTYMVRPPKGQDGGPSHYVTRDGQPFDRQAFEAAMWDDPLVFLIIVSPEVGEGIPMDDFCRSFWLQVERRLGKPLRWVSASHYDTDHPHFHTILGGRTRTGAPLRLPKGFMRHGLRELSQEVLSWYM